MEGISIKGIVLGAIATLVADVVAGVGLTLALSTKDSLASEEAVAQFALSTPFLVGSLILGTLSTVLGGYVAARIAKRRHYANAAVIGIAGVVLGLALSGDYPLWFNAIGFLFVIPAALWGGYLAMPREGNA